MAFLISEIVGTDNFERDENMKQKRQPLSEIGIFKSITSPSRTIEVQSFLSRTIENQKEEAKTKWQIK